jgi:FAD/FMN-containing dehydrogenase
MAVVEVHSWGRLGRWPHELRPLADHALAALPLAAGQTGLAWGMGRSYGDACLNPGGALWLTRGRDRLIGWDEATGLLTCESGMRLQDIQRLMTPRGWMLPVTPGTQLVTVGGAIANDVHGKSHHVTGAFGNHVAALQLLRTSGERIDCGPDRQGDWFAATVGGLGLTGVITQATLRLRRVEGPWLDAETIAYRGLDEFFRLSEDSSAGWEHTVAWVDCLDARSARGIFMRANHSAARQGPRPKAGGLRMPLTPPFSLVNALSLRAFNAAYYRTQQARAGRKLVHYEPFFYPLDGVAEWNRMYGPRGFYQYQCVLPPAAGPDGIAHMLECIAAGGHGSFLAVLKTFGERPACGLLSFARPGVTLALDFPNRGQPTLALFERLDAIVAQSGGALYPAKDARMPRALFEQGYPRWREFLRYRDPGIDSAFARRVMT